MPGARDGLASGRWGARLPWGVPGRGARAASGWLASGRRLTRPAPLPPECPRAMSPGSREGAGECLGQAEGPGVEEAGVSLSPARPLSRLGKVGRGRAGISVLGEGTPEPGGGRELCTGSREGECPQRTQTRTRASRRPGKTREPGVRARLEPAEEERAGLRRDPPPRRPSQALGAQLTPRLPLWPRVPVRSRLPIETFPESLHRRPAVFAAPARGLALASPVSRSLQRWGGTPRSAHSGCGTLTLVPRPAAARRPRPAPLPSAPQRATHPRWAGGEAPRVLRGAEKRFAALGREQAGSQGAQAVPSSVGRAPSQAPCAGPVPRALLLCPVGFFFILSARVEGPCADSSLERDMPVPGPGCQGPKAPNLGAAPLPAPSSPTPAPPICAAPRFPSVNPTAPPEPCSASFSSPSSVSPSAPKTFTNTPQPTRRRGNTPLSVAVQLEDGGSERKRG